MTADRVLEIFKEICAIPRESGYEEPITAWLIAWAQNHGFEYKVDETGNVLIVRQAASGREHVPAIVLQAHQDMVCEKNAGVQHDFRKDPIKFQIRDGWMVADDTTLGADDGIGIAAALALLEDDTPTGKIECVFTISEETGMDGAINMKNGFFSAKTLINLDSEDEGELFIGCAGGLNSDITFNYSEVPVDAGKKVLKIKLFGGIGGHSGDDINKERVNAVQCLSRFLYGQLPTGFQLVSYKGGGKSNAIARECEAVVAVDNAESFGKSFRDFVSTIKTEYHSSDPGIDGIVEDAAATVAIDADTTNRLITSMFACPHGIWAMSQDVKGLVETSTNLAAVSMPGDGRILIITSQRSPAHSERIMIADKVKANFTLAGAEVVQYAEYPGWEPNVNSEILKQSVASYKKLFGVEPVVRAIHAGLECGMFLEKFGNLDMISFGPTLRGVHAPGERMDLASLDKFVALLQDVVCQFK